MKVLLLSVMSLVMLSGCVSHKLTYEDGMRIRTAGETNLLRPSLSVLEVSVCVKQTGLQETHVHDGKTETCEGFYHPLATVQGTQSGALTGLGGAMVQGGAIVGGAYLLGDGIRDSSTEVSQNGASDSSSQSKSQAKSYSRSKQSQTNNVKGKRH